MTARVAVASRSFSRHKVLRAELLEHFRDVKFNEAGESLSGGRLISFLDGYDMAIVGLERISDEVLAALPRLKTIAKYGVGLDGLDTEAMKHRGVHLGWTAGVNRRSVSELALSFMIAMLRRIPAVNAELRAGKWSPLIGRQLSSCTVGIVGCGHVGKDLVGLLQPLGPRILAHDIRSFPDFYAAHGVEARSLDDLLAESDIVTLHVPLDGTTRNLLSRERLARLKHGALLLNTARGGLVDEESLKQALKSGQLAGAAFDVFAGEPVVDEELLRLPNFLATPHIGGSTEEAVLAMGRAAITGLLKPQPATTL